MRGDERRAGRRLATVMGAAVPAVGLAIGLAACGGGSHEAAPSSTSTTPTLPRKLLTLVAAKYPARLVGSLVFTIDRQDGDPAKSGGAQRKYTITLSDVTLGLAQVRGKGLKQAARYTVTGGRASARGFEDITNSKCRTTHIVWTGRNTGPITGALVIDAPRFSSGLSYQFLIPQRGTTSTRKCGSTGPGTPSTVTRTARIANSGSLKLSPASDPTRRFGVFIEVQNVTAGSIDNGRYTINGQFHPPADGSVPVRLCSDVAGKLKCPAA